jgi:hypothetical protein
VWPEFHWLEISHTFCWPQKPLSSSTASSLSLFVDRVPSSSIHFRNVMMSSFVPCWSIRLSPPYYAGCSGPFTSPKCACISGSVRAFSKAKYPNSGATQLRACFNYLRSLTRKRAMCPAPMPFPRPSGIGEAIRCQIWHARSSNCLSVHGKTMWQQTRIHFQGAPSQRALPSTSEARP